KLTAFNLVASRPTEEISLWDQLSAKAFAQGLPVPTCIGSLDAPGVMKVAGRHYQVPTSRDVFRVLTPHVLLATPLLRSDGDTSADIDAINHAIESGFSYICYDIFGKSSGFRFTISSDGKCAGL